MDTFPHEELQWTVAEASEVERALRVTYRGAVEFLTLNDIDTADDANKRNVTQRRIEIYLRGYCD